MLLAFFAFWPDFGAGLIAIARGFSIAGLMIAE